MKESSAKYQWFAESLEFAVQATNVTGNIEEVELNRYLVRDYFEMAMEVNMTSGYTLTQFSVVSKGESVPGGIARSPGYMAAIKVPIFCGDVPLVGYERIDVPMRYFAVAESDKI